jgi:hypothetical protein
MEDLRRALEQRAARENIEFIHERDPETVEAFAALHAKHGGDIHSMLRDGPEALDVLASFGELWIEVESEGDALDTPVAPVLTASSPEEPEKDDQDDLEAARREESLRARLVRKSSPLEETEKPGGNGPAPPSEAEVPPWMSLQRRSGWRM